jgi:hypothetical protein
MNSRTAAIAPARPQGINTSTILKVGDTAYFEEHHVLIVAPYGSHKVQQSDGSLITREGYGVSYFEEDDDGRYFAAAGWLTNDDGEPTHLRAATTNTRIQHRRAKAA